jgi:hypothetical protein
MANAIALTWFVGKTIRADFPFVIMGHSGGSGGGMGAAKTHRGDIRQQAHLPTDTADTWSPAIPFFWSGPTIYGQSVYRAINAIGESRAREQIDYACLYATCFVYERQFWKSTVAAMQSSSEPFVRLCVRTVVHCVAILWQRFLTFLKNICVNKVSRQPLYPVKDIGEAICMARRRVVKADLMVECEREAAAR